MDETVARECCVQDLADDASKRNQIQHHEEQQVPEYYRVETMNADDTAATEHTRKSIFATARPPRAPNHLSIHNESPKQHPESTQMSRSTSQPRASVLFSENSTATSTRSSSRSVSQPRASHGHFLHGFNVADCFDVRSIPDPPSPEQVRSRRRVSTAMILPRLGDVTNQGTRKDIGDIEFTKSSVSGNRKRKSLAHVPSPSISPIVPDQRDDPVPCEQERQMNSNIEVHPRTLQVELCLDSNEEDDDGGMRSRASPKRRKKRQSMILPDHRALQNDVAVCHEDSLSACERPSDTQHSPSKTKRFFPGDMQSLMGLRSLVHEYCALSEEQRATSEQAKHIRETTGYALLSSSPDAFVSTNTSSHDILANRRLVLQKISPVMMQMEKRRGQETKQWERDTGCRVEKSNRSGKYKYYCIESNQRVSTQEYNRRYMLVIEGREEERKAWTKAWMDKLHESTDVDEESKGGHTSEIVIPDTGAEEHAESSDPATLDGVVQDDTIFRSDFRENEDSQREAFRPPMAFLSRSSSTASKGRAIDSLDPSVLSTSLGTVETSNFSSFPTVSMPSKAIVTMSAGEREEPAEISEASSEDTDESPDSRSSSPDITVTGENPLAVTGFVAEREVQGSCFHDQIQVKDEYVHEVVAAKALTLPLTEAEGTPILPFPSRDVESTDPDIARAESRLWDKIDLALQEYSAEVVIIMKSKQIGNREQSTSIAL